MSQRPKPKAHSAKIILTLGVKAEIPIQEAEERLGEQALTIILEQLHNLAILKKETPLGIMKRLKRPSKRGGRARSRSISTQKAFKKR